MMKRVTLGVLLVLGLSLSLLSQNAQEIYQRALVQEQAAGKLPQAIELYLQAAKEAGKDRTLAAKALIRAAGSREKLGQPEAADLYAEVMRVYPEQREQAQTAQMRLAALTQKSPLVEFRQLPVPSSPNSAKTLPEPAPSSYEGQA